MNIYNHAWERKCAHLCFQAITYLFCLSVVKKFSASDVFMFLYCLHFSVKLISFVLGYLFHFRLSQLSFSIKADWNKRKILTTIFSCIFLITMFLCSTFFVLNCNYMSLQTCIYMFMCVKDLYNTRISIVSNLITFTVVN